MRVGLDYRPGISNPHNGIGRQNLALAKVLEELPGVDLHLFTPAPLDHPLRATAHCPTWDSTVDGQHRLPRRLRFELGYMPWALRRAGIDVHISTFNMGLPLPPRPSGVRYVLQLHDLFQLHLKNHHATWLRETVYRISDNLSIRYSVNVADRIWTPSQYSADEVARVFPSAAPKVRVLSNLVPSSTLEPMLPEQPLPSRFWLLVGTREPRKNIAWFIEHWHKARLTDPAIPDLVLVGGGEFVAPQQRELPGVHLMPTLGDAELQGLYGAAERLWHPSYAEGFGLPVIEAMAVGTPVAVASGTSLDEIVPEGTPRFSPYDAAAVIELMHRLARPDEPDRQVLRDWARRYAEQPYRARVAELLQELQS
ncbi:glycosyltransferase family 4 protein [Pseudomonas sihuiensis]|uniref:Glycosyltransferase involved in cell wall bisynthesis n=1 Tax=Pseudomonas sihuiensis TaxID=1274359 RepID=A0A1H2MJT4_9PSED|nr:glycosyltransferase family 1 protein [Pseudomonas sihuiensis]SDU93392.1 Glycosyltransferase involved in cell wall bisynthesis [Pseudomonas sihuiensis]